MKITEIQKVPKNRIGRIEAKNVHLEAHEYDTMLFLSQYGFDIEVIKPANIPRTHNPDFLINGGVWEAKSPEGQGKYNLQRQFHNAGHQAGNLVLDLRRFKMPASCSEKDALKRFGFSRSIKHLLLITKDGRLLDIRK